MGGPALSVVIVVYNMEREARRSLHAFSAAYQQGVSADDYEVVVVDNGSTTPFNGGSIEEFGPNFRYRYLADASESAAHRSPVRAMNIGIAMAHSDYLALVFDGARIVTPGLLRYGLMLPKIFANPCGLTLGWHLGPDVQSRSMMQGYNQEIEDALLARIEWPAHGYRLFEISSPHDAADGWFRLIAESTCTFTTRALLAEVGGFDERYVTPGGGMASLDVQTRFYELPHADLVTIVGEGTFHQFHGGATSGTPATGIKATMDEFFAEYERIRGRPFTPITGRRPHLVGHIPVEALGFLGQSIDAAHPELLKADAKAAWLQKEVDWRSAVIEHRDAAIAWLKDEVAQRDATIARLEGNHSADHLISPPVADGQS